MADNEILVPLQISVLFTKTFVGAVVFVLTTKDVLGEAAVGAVEQMPLPTVSRHEIVPATVPASVYVVPVPTLFPFFAH